jgi:hypothetical protein
MAWNVIASKPASFFKTRFEVPLSFVCFANSVVRNDGAIFINHSTFFVAPLRPFDNPFGILRDLVGPTQNIGWRSRFDRKVHFYKASSLINWYVMKRWRPYIPIAQYVINLRKANSQLFQLRC